MHIAKVIDKREFIQHTSKYLRWVEQGNRELIIAYQNRPDLAIRRIKNRALKEIRGIVEIRSHGDINEPILPGYDEW